MRQRANVIAVTAAVILVVAGFLAPPARADAIDGDWCHGTSHLSIDGDTIVTPGRTKIQGRYTRYSFDYVVPSNEPGAGHEVTMRMMRGQELVHVNRKGQTGDPEIWRRCKPIS
jgi:hypothetical protein